MAIQFKRQVSITLTANVSNDFTLEVSHRHQDGDRSIWIASLIDYDDNIGVQGEFTSETEFLENAEGFLTLARKLYEKKQSKYGITPIIRLVDGELRTDQKN
jgi:hypothetical protein